MAPNDFCWTLQGVWNFKKGRNVNFPISLFSSRNMRYIKTQEFINWLIIRICFGITVCKNVAISIIIFANCNELRYFQYLHLWSDDTVAISFFFMLILKRAPCIYARQSWRATEAVVSSSQCVADKWIKFPGNHRFGQQFGHFYCSKNPLFSVERQLLSM